MTVVRAPSSTRIRRTATDGRVVSFAVTVTIPRLPSTGVVRITDRGRVVRTVQFTGAPTRTVRVSLPRGSHVVRAVFAGSDVARPQHLGAGELHPPVRRG